ncbi:MAG: hypothetical protein K6T70_06265 [Meiothermus ruber]|nr:hypothetical protein [Meiothermus ruber]
MQERLKKAIQQVARPPHLDFLALYPATVLKDYEDMHVDVQADDPRLGALTRVPIWLGLPGAAVKVAPGARVLVGFHGGDPELRYCDLWRGEGLREVTLTASVRVLVNSPLVELGGAGGSGVLLQGQPLTFVFQTNPVAMVPVTGTVQAGGSTKVRGVQ